MDLSGLPHFRVDTIRSLVGDVETILIGQFSHLRGVRNDHGALYRAGGRPMNGRLSRVPTSEAEAVEFTTPDAGLAKELAPGVTYPWVDGYWQAYHVAMILAGRWAPRVFSATPARYFRLNGVTGWQPEDAPLLEGAQDLGVREGAWDHEHCELCRARIGAPGDRQGYVDPEDHWLCARCYQQYALTRDVSFAAET
jgi:hypothetical protein